MNKLIVNLPSFSRLRSYCEEIANFALSINSDFGAAARTAAPYVILGCLCVWVYVTHKWRTKRTPVLTMSKTFAEIHGGDLALQRLVDYEEAHENPAMSHKRESVIKDLLDQEHFDLKKLQRTVANVEMSGSEASAVDKLRKVEKEHAEKPQEAYEIGMLLVEMLIFKGDFKEALECECLTHEEIADARRPLYKAIIHIMLGDSKEAEEYWEEFVDIRRQFIHFTHPSSLSEGTCNTITNFQQFEKKVKQLKRAIEDITAKNKA